MASPGSVCAGLTSGRILPVVEVPQDSMGQTFRIKAMPTSHIGCLLLRRQPDLWPPEASDLKIGVGVGHEVTKPADARVILKGVDARVSLADHGPERLRQR